ncbi:transposase [Polaromonas sp. P2-4]|nr:transposase [Polaromonas sp. P2-4]
MFASRSAALIKVLYFDRSGWCVWAKRLEAGRFITDWSRVHTREIDCTQLKLLLEGIEPRRQLKRYRHEAAAQDRKRLQFGTLRGRLESRGWSAPWLPMAEIFQLSTEERVEVLNPAANTVTTTMSVK